ncbi:hypothetical protein ACFLTZ_04090 [Chloroflexota bacterium]
MKRNWILLVSLALVLVIVGLAGCSESRLVMLLRSPDQALLVLHLTTPVMALPCAYSITKDWPKG